MKHALIFFLFMGGEPVVMSPGVYPTLETCEAAAIANPPPVRAVWACIPESIFNEGDTA